jgi:hypothetical protein
LTISVPAVVNLRGQRLVTRWSNPRFDKALNSSANSDVVRVVTVDTEVHFPRKIAASRARFSNLVFPFISQWDSGGWRFSPSALTALRGLITH